MKFNYYSINTIYFLIPEIYKIRNMKYSFTIFTILILFFFSSCKKENAADAMGTFEADEIISIDNFKKLKKHFFEKIKTS